MSAPTATERRLDAHHRLRPGRDDLVVVLDGLVEVFLARSATPPVAPDHLATLAPGDALPGTAWAGDLDQHEYVELVGNGPAVVAIRPGDGAESATGTAELVARLAEIRRPLASLTTVTRRLAADAQRGADATGALAAIFGRRDPASVSDAPDAGPVLRALVVAARASGLRLQPAAVAAARALGDADVPRLASKLRVPVRAVDLSGPWWREEGLPMVAVDGPGITYAVVRRRHGWAAWSVAAGWQEVTAGLGAAFTEAWCVYPALPARPVGLRDLLRVGLPPGARRDFVRVATSAVAVSVLGAGVPLAAAAILGDAVPRAESGNVLAIAVLVTGLVVAFSAASVVQGLLLQRLVGQLNVRTTAAVWARVLRLDPSFFRGYNPGELARRVLAVDGIRDLVTASVVAGGIGLLIGVTGTLVTFLLDVWAGLATIAGLAGYAVFAARQLRRMVRARRRQVAQRNTISGFVTALLTGIVKVRVANAERRLYARWAAMFAREQSAAAATVAAQRQLTVLTAAAPALGTLLVVAVTAYSHGARLSIGTFVGLVGALTQVTTALSLVLPALSQLTEAVPLYDAARPVFRATPRVATDAADPGVLTGRVEVSKVSFAYTEDGPPTLNSVDLAAAPGEFIAVVGPSGAGKSTLIRLLLGFDRPTAGAVLYDGKPLDSLDVEAVRRQIGVVTQNAQVPTGSILTAIVGTTNLTQEQAWEALEMAGLAADVRRMPMGIRTVISEGAATFSGGQRQRLTIAKALVRRPRILIFDEATSALDNITQQTVTHSLQQLNATRIVIAHRLTTIRDAHRIFVLDGGGLVEQGGYAALAHRDGVFARLARRQLT